MNKESAIKTKLHVRIENVDFQLLVVTPARDAEDLKTNEAMLHNHMFHELFVCGCEEMIIKTFRGDVVLGFGEIAVIPPSFPHVLKRLENDDEGFVIPFICKGINDEGCVDVYKKLLPIVGDEIFISRNHPHFLEKVQLIVEKELSKKSEHFLTALHFFEILFELTKCEKEANVIKSENAGDNMGFNDIMRMMTLDNMIANRYTEKNFISLWAKELFISTRQLDRIVTKSYGKSLFKVVTDKRFELAKRLLTDTNLTVEEVALKSGFSSIASLYREFKKRLDITPATFRLK